MSVFESIKGTFHSVQQDIVDGFKALTSLDSQPRHDMLRRLRTDGINLDAGADLLNKYQQTWKELQEYTTTTAKKAEDVDSEIGKIYVRWDRQSDVVSRFEEEVAELPVVVTLIKKLTNDLSYIKEDCRVVEGALERLENVCEEMDQQKNMKSHIAQLTTYKQKKADEVQKVKVQMAKQHVQAMQDCDKKRHVDLKERQEAFGDAFSQDMHFYKTHGHLEQLKVSDIPIPKVSSLSDITIDDDQMFINDFLSSAETTPSRDRSTGDLGEASEGGFFEDDYTAQYNIQSDEDILDDEIDQMTHEPPKDPESADVDGDIDTEDDRNKSEIVVEKNDDTETETNEDMAEISENQSNSSKDADEKGDKSVADGEKGDKSVADGEKGGSSEADGEKGDSSEADGKKGDNFVANGEHGDNSVADGEKGDNSVADGEKGDNSVADGDKGGSSEADGEKGDNSAADGETS